MLKARLFTEAPTTAADKAPHNEQVDAQTVVGNLKNNVKLALGAIKTINQLLFKDNVTVDADPQTSCMIEELELIDLMVLMVCEEVEYMADRLGLTADLEGRDAK